MNRNGKKTNAEKAGTHMMRARLFLPVLVVLILLTALPHSAAAQERLSDTLRVVNATIPVGDTADVFIYMRNTDTLGGYSLRLRFDPAVVGVAHIPDNDSTVQVFSVRGSWFNFSGGISTNAVTLVAAFPDAGPDMVSGGGGAILGLDDGRGNTVRFRFFARQGVTAGTTTQVIFEDAPYDTNAYNWFANWTGLYQYRPKRIAGTLTIGGGSVNHDPTIDAISSPKNTSPGTPVSFAVTARDQDNDPVTLTAYDLPSGATFTPTNPVTGTGTATGTFSWTPGTTQTGAFTVRFRAADNKSGVSPYTSVVINVSAGGVPTIDPLTSPINTRQGNLVEFSVRAQDPEGQTVTLTAYGLPTGATFSPSNPVSGTGSVTGVFHWSPNFDQSGPFTVQFRAEDNLGNLSPFSSVLINVEEIQRDQLFTTSVEGQAPQGGIPGATGLIIPINFVATVPVFGVQFDFVYDAAVFIVTDLVPTTRLDGFSVYENIGETPGRIRVVTFSLTGDSIRASGSILFNVAGRISAAAAPGRYDLKFENAWESIDPDPQVASKELEVTAGDLFVDNRGDVNLDTRVDVADVVSVVANILGSFSFTGRQFGAADVVSDVEINVYDLVGIINIIFGRPIQPAPTNFGEGPLARVQFPFDADVGSDGEYRLITDSPAEVAGIQADIIYDPLQVKLVPPEAGSAAARLILSYRDNGAGRMTVVMYYNPTDPTTILPSGENEIFGMRIEPGPAGIAGDLPPVKLRDVKLCTPEAAKIFVEGYTDVPRAFELYQNYPNPFNPRTVIEFTLAPTDGAGGLIPTRLEVYNILGQKMATLVNAALPPGRHTVEWLGATENGRPLSSGIYFYKLIAGTQSETKKMVLLK